MSLQNGLQSLERRLDLIRQQTKLALSERDAAKAIGVCQRTLWQRAKDGDIPFLRIGGRKLYRVSSLEAYLAEKEKEGDARHD